MLLFSVKRWAEDPDNLVWIRSRSRGEGIIKMQFARNVIFIDEPN